MLKGYDNFFIPVSNLEEARRFYQETLGLSVKFDFSSRGLLAFKVGQEEPALILREQPGSKPSILFEVADVRTAYTTLQERGLRFLSEPYEIKTGLAVEFEDPFGNRFGLTDYSKGT